uniref:hypothetical protein n=1 Tax=Streptomyces sp. FR1 TaxID=349971 RepID=UPI0015631254|nr:hypothetical protein [Streptomyces sp. FR1]
MPVEPYLTPRQLRTIADRVEALTKARINNQDMGIPTTPNRFECRFPSGHRGTVTWLDAPFTSAAARDRNGGKPVFRYVVQLHTPAYEPPIAAEKVLPDAVDTEPDEDDDSGTRYATAGDGDIGGSQW